MNSKKFDSLVFIGIALYCLVFAAIRLSISDSMELDEAEQFWDASHFALGYSRQPPLYSWIGYAVTFFTGMNIYVLTVIKYLILGSFYSGFYNLAKSIFEREKAVIALMSLFLFSVFFYDFIFDLTHTVLLTSIAVWAYYFYIRVVLGTQLRDYVLFGISLGLGMLSKYNFIFLIITLVFVSLHSAWGRKALFSPKTFLTLLTASLIFLPHFIWLNESDFLSLSYAMGTGEAGKLSLSVSGILLSLFKSYFPQIALFFVFFVLIFYPAFSMPALSNTSKLREEERLEATQREIFHLLRLMALYSIFLPIAIILIFQIAKFHARWLTTVYPIVSLAACTYLRNDQWRSRTKFLTTLFTLIIASTLSMRIAFAFYPDILAKARKTNIAFSPLAESLSQRIEEHAFSFNEVVIIAYHKHLAANMKMKMPEAKILLFSELTAPDIVELEERGDPIFLIWSTERRSVYQKRMPKEMRKAFPGYAYEKFIKADYLYSRNFDPYVIGLASIL